ncbi:MAG: methyltransferase family protein [Candidatus Hermodarchaeota archaeon]
MPFYFLSVEHTKLQKKYGKEKGLRIAEILGLTSGWCFFLFLFGLWFSPQPQFLIPIFNFELNSFQLFYFSIQVFHIIISIPIIFIGAWFGIVGVKEITLKVAETHKPDRIIDTGIYSKFRHPQYLGAILSHIGISILLSSLYSLLTTPLIIFLIYIMSWKEEKELLKEFGQGYENYRRSVPMFFPRLKKRKMKST